MAILWEGIFVSRPAVRNLSSCVMRLSEADRKASTLGIQRPAQDLYFMFSAEVDGGKGAMGPSSFAELACSMEGGSFSVAV